jgi:cobalt-zinc-cadmium efflux system outer membrane protein
MRTILWFTAAMLPLSGAHDAEPSPSPTVGIATETRKPTETGTLRLANVIPAALSRGPLVEAARARVRAAEAARSTAQALPNPILTWQVENARFPGASVPGVDRETSTYASLPLEFLFQRAPQVRRAEESVRAAEADLAAARWLVVLDATRAFGRVLTAQAALDAATDLRAGLSDLYSFNQTRVAEGVTAEGDLIRVRVERDRAALEEAMAEAELARAWAELRPFVPALAVAPLPRLVIERAAPPAVPALAALLQRSKQSQPEIRAARARFDASRAEVSFQRRLSVRQVGLVFGNKRVAGENTMIAGLSVSVPLFNRNRGDIARADAERTAAEQELAWTERRAAARVEGAHRAAEVMASRLDSLSPDLLERAEESRRIAVAAYREGAGTLLQVLDASRALVEVRETYGRALFAGNQSLLELRAMSGEDPLEGAADTVPEGGHQ